MTNDMPRSKARERIRTRIFPSALVRMTRPRVACALIFFVTGCADLPDMSQFVEASSQLVVSVRSVGDTAASHVRFAAEVAEDTNKDKLTTMAEQLETAWEAHVRAMESAATYARSVQEVAEAGNTGKENAEELIEGVRGFVNEAKVAFSLTPASAAASEAIEVAADLVAVLYGELAKGLARKQLIDIMKTLDPIVAKTAQGLGKSLNALSDIVLAMREIRLNALENSFEQPLFFRDSLEIRRSRIYAVGLPKPEHEASEALRTLKELEKAIQDTDVWYQPYLEQEQAIRSQTSAETEAVAAAANGLREWGAIHGQLLMAVEEGRGIDVAQLQATILVIYDTLERLHDREPTVLVPPKPAP